MSMCACGKPIEHLQAPEDSAEWSCRVPLPLPNQADVDALRDLLDLMVNFPSNDQRARYLLSSNWMRDRDSANVEKGEARGRLRDKLQFIDAIQRMVNETQQQPRIK